VLFNNCLSRLMLYKKNTRLHIMRNRYFYVIFIAFLISSCTMSCKILNVDNKTLINDLLYNVNDNLPSEW